MRGALAFLFYAAALFLIYAGFNVPGGEGLNTHVIPRGDAELLSVLLILNGCASKLMGT
jgi:hypothetical protein